MKLTKQITGLYVALTLLIGAVACNSNTNSVQSPDGTISFSVTIKEGKNAVYSVKADKKEILKPSELGFVIAGADTVTKFNLLSVETDSFDETWETVWGESRFVRNNYNEMLLNMQQYNGDLKLNLRVRVFDDGVAFRYEFPTQDVDSLVIMEELTTFNFADNHNAWYLPAADPYYEDHFYKKSIAELDTVRTPLTIEGLNGKYFAIHEAQLVDYPKMDLYGVGTNELKAQLVKWSSGEAAFIATPFVTPWRTMIIADRVGDLITSNLMLNLNEPCAIDDTSWIKPMKYIGIWWEMHLFYTTWYAGPRHGATTKRMKEYIDFAADNGIPGVLAEGWNIGWEGDWPRNQHFDFTKPYPDFNIKEITDYAKSKGIEVIGHHETAAWTTNYENQLDAAYDFYKSYGIDNVKTGYVNILMDGKERHDSQYGVRHYRKVVETAAKHGITIDNHEPVMPTGWQRTYPNLMTQEGIRGQEHDAWDLDGGNPPQFTTVAPFVRGLAGPMDFTFGTFNFDNPNSPHARVQTTIAKQLALYVVIYSPLQMASDLPENYRGNKAFDFIKDVPVDWDTTQVVDAVIGDYVVTARKDRNSDDWYVGAITDENAREYSLKLDFLAPDATYVAQIYADGDDADWVSNPTSFKYEEVQVTSNDTLQLKLATGGGTAIRFAKQ
ncbi:MAG: glycoside hydrolase family 97 protein [Muribaculaceae bacterium]|nr:glycoside hydrolase family 97 protein [Muribaculaceae bacterium]